MVLFIYRYEKVKEMLSPNPYPNHRTLPKIKAMEAAAAYESMMKEIKFTLLLLYFFTYLCYLFRWWKVFL